jgi:hypothetical protein
VELQYAYVSSVSGVETVFGILVLRSYPQKTFLRAVISEGVSIPSFSSN